MILKKEGKASERKNKQTNYEFGLRHWHGTSHYLLHNTFLFCSSCFISCEASNYNSEQHVWSRVLGTYLLQKKNSKYLIQYHMQEIKMQMYQGKIVYMTVGEIPIKIKDIFSALEWI